MAEENTEQAETPADQEVSQESAARLKTGADLSRIGTAISSQADTSDQVPLWLITFTDVMALLLTFFVLLYSMAQPDVEKWTAMMSNMTAEFSKYTSAEWQAGAQDTISIEKTDFSRALSLDYLRALLAEVIEKDPELGDVLIFQDRTRLILSLPSDLLFETGQAGVTDQGRDALFELGGVLARIRNKIEVVGHSDPRPLGNGARFSSNWDLSLARAASVAGVLTTVGYRRNITALGLSSALFEELPDELSDQRRLELARRVDILIRPDDGSERMINVFDP